MQMIVISGENLHHITEGNPLVPGEAVPFEELSRVAARIQMLTEILCSEVVDYHRLRYRFDANLEAERVALYKSLPEEDKHLAELGELPESARLPKVSIPEIGGEGAENFFVTFEGNFTYQQEKVPALIERRETES